MSDFRVIDAPQIVQTEAQLAAMIHITVKREEIRLVMGPGIQEVMGALAAQGIAPTGPWFTHHLKMSPDIFDFEICVPVATPVAAVGRVKPGELRAAKVARTLYRGSYEGLGDAWKELSAWITAQGHTTAPGLLERYIKGPESGSDPSGWCTELNKVLVA